MEEEGFTVNEVEWWHFDYKDWRKYPILNQAFEEDSLSRHKTHSPTRKRETPSSLACVSGLPLRVFRG